MMNEHRMRRPAAVVLAIGLPQVGLYLAAWFIGRRADFLFYVMTLRVTRQVNTKVEVRPRGGREWILYLARPLSVP